MKVEIRVSREEDAAALSDIRVRSKGHWGYSREMLETWRPDMVVTPEYIRTATVRSIFVDNDLVGFYALQHDQGLLDHLWLTPEVIGKGVGRFAFLHAVEVAQGLAMKTLLIISDVNAEGFYLRMGAQRVGEVYSPQQNRSLPQLLFRIPEALPFAAGGDASGTPVVR